GLPRSAHQQEFFEPLVPVLAGRVARGEAAALLAVRVGAVVEQQLAELVAGLRPLVLGRGGRVQRAGLDVLVAGERVRVGAAVEQEPRRLDMAEEAGEPERLEAVVAERVRSGRLFVQQLAYPPCPAERSGLEYVQLRVAREQPGHVVAAVER